MLLKRQQMALSSSSTLLRTSPIMALRRTMASHAEVCSSFTAFMKKKKTYRNLSSTLLLETCVNIRSLKYRVHRYCKDYWYGGTCVSETDKLIGIHSLTALMKKSAVNYTYKMYPPTGALLWIFRHWVVNKKINGFCIFINPAFAKISKNLRYKYI